MAKKQYVPFNQATIPFLRCLIKF